MKHTVVTSTINIRIIINTFNKIALPQIMRKKILQSLAAADSVDLETKAFLKMRIFQFPGQY